MQLFFMLLPIIAAVIILVFALIRGFDKTALALSLSIAMVIAMFIMKYNGTWYSIIFALTVPLAVSYLIICMFLSMREDKAIAKAEQDVREQTERIRAERKNRKKKKK